MELPNYYIADLLDASTLTAKLISEACATLKENREKFLLPRSTDSIVTVLSTLARDWLDPEFPFRLMALEAGPAKTGFARQTLAAGLDRFFAQVTRPNIEALIVQDLGSIRRLDDIVASEVEVKEDRAAMARGFPLLVQITGGVLPNPSITSLMLGLLARSAQFIKCASGTSFVPRMFAHSLYAIHPKLAACIEIAEWKGGNHSLEKALFAEADCVTATGGDSTLDEIRKRLSAKVQFLGYGHKLSLAFVSRESLSAIKRQQLVSTIAEDILAWNQLGCLSPHAVYVESGGALHPADLAELIARELAKREQDEPRGEISTESAAAIATRRMLYQVRASAGDATKLWTSENSTAWTVVYEQEPLFQLSCLNRFIYVKAVADADEFMRAIASLEGQISTVGLSAPAERITEIALRLARAGVSRVCGIGQMQNPPLTWRHDGRPALGDLVSWTDIEFA